MAAGESPSGGGTGAIGAASDWDLFSLIRIRVTVPLGIATPMASRHGPSSTVDSDQDTVPQHSKPCQKCSCGFAVSPLVESIVDDRRAARGVLASTGRRSAGSLP